MLLQSKIAVITGGASGQGRATAALYLDEGAEVIILDWNAAQGAETVSELSRQGARISYVQCDLGDAAQVREACAGILERTGGIDILFNNAGIGYSASSRYPMNSFLEAEPEDWDAIMRINLTGAYLMSKYLVPSLIEKGEGVVIFNTSIAGLVGQLNIDAYTASKGALVALTRAMAASLGPKGIRVNAIAPGAIDTPMVAGVLASGDAQSRLNNIPLRRIGRPEDIAGLALYLAGPHSAYVTGQIIACDGGRVAI